MWPRRFQRNRDRATEIEVEQLRKRENQVEDARWLRMFPLAMYFTHDSIYIYVSATLSICCSFSFHCCVNKSISLSLGLHVLTVNSSSVLFFLMDLFTEKTDEELV